MDNSLGLIAGSGSYPLTLARQARAAGRSRIVVAAFERETRPEISEVADEVEWMRVGQLGRMIKFFQRQGVTEAIMAGQIAPSNLFDLRPDLKALMILGRLKQRNAESIFSAIADELAQVGVTLLDATTYMDEALAPAGVICGPALRVREQADIAYGFQIAKEVSRLDIGQTVIVRNGTVLAVEAFEGTNQAIKRGGALGKKNSIMIKVSKPNQDLRFDVPVVGTQTLETAHEAHLRVIAVEAGKTILLDPENLHTLAERHRITLFGLSST